MIGRIAAVVALAIGVVVVFMLLTGGEDEYEVTAEFENASQLVTGNEVVVGGARIGSVSKIELGPQGHALVTFTVGEDYAPLSRGTTATVRSPSLSQIAGRQVQLNLPPDSTAGDPIETGETLSLTETTSEVDLDQLFNTLSPKTIKDLKHVIEGFEQSYDGVGEQANEGLKYLNPLLSTSRKVFGELNADQTAFENLIVDTSQLSGALAERAPDISALVGNLESDDERDRRSQGAARERRQPVPRLHAPDEHDFRQLARNARRRRPARRRLEAGSPRAAALPGGSFARPRPTRCRRSGTSTRSCSAPGATTISSSSLEIQPDLTEAAVGSGSPDCGSDPTNVSDLQVPADDDFDQGSFGEAVCALSNGEPPLEFFRAYTPELVGWFDDFGHSGFIDGDRRHRAHRHDLQPVQRLDSRRPARHPRAGI